MKKFLILLAALFIGTAVADTETIHWYVDGVESTTTCESGGDLILPNPPQKNGYVFIGWVPNYIPIEYIESTGTQYIDTGFAPNQDTRFVIEYSLGTIQHDAKGIAAARTAYTQAQFGILVGQSSFRSDYGNGAGTPGIVYGGSLDSYVNQKIKADKNKNITNWYNNQGALIQTISHSVQSFQTNVSLYLFALNDGGTVYVQPDLKVYSFQLYDSGTLVRDMIPVLDSAGVPCMYDKVSEQFFYNAGTGDFIAGPIR